MYAELPNATRTYATTRDNGLIVVKQIFKASYWEKDEDRSHSDDNERTVVTVRLERRAINVLRLDPLRREAEIRIDRVRGQQDDSLATELFEQFQQSLQHIIDIDKHFAPVPIWNGFRRIVADLKGTYMSTDSAEDPSVVVHIPNRRASDRGTDVRRHDSYQYATTEYTRNSLNIYWRKPDEPDEKIHTILSRVDRAGRTPYAKVYVAAKLTPDDLSNVLERIRQSARDAS
jgi:hypothetical protein